MSNVPSERLATERTTDSERDVNLSLHSRIIEISKPSGYFICQQEFCPHSVLVGFVWNSEQTAIISLYNINWLFVVTEI